MSVLSNFPIRHRLLVLASVSGLGLVALGLVGFRTIQKVKVNGPMYADIVLGKDLVADILPPPEYLVEAHLVAHQLVSGVVHDLGDEPLEACVARLGKLKEEYDARHTYWDENLVGDELRDALLVQSFEPAKTYWEVVERELIPAARRRDKASIDEILEGPLATAYTEHRAGVDHTVALTNSRNAEIEKSAAAELAAQLWTVGAIGAAILLAVGWIAWAITRSIVGPLDVLVAKMGELARGEGDLTTRLDTSGKDETSLLSANFNEFVGKLQHMVVKVKDVARDTTVAAQELSSTATNIAGASQEQASALEQTAASLEEITGTVKQNAENAAQASQLASTSHKVAEKGGRVVQETVEAIGRINDASGRIADIITTIDEIAFQTNLLALNAAVEAARAGEHGRGFAVVASEVRNLAQRSAEAAKEIRGLIRDSSDKVQSGTKLANESGDTLAEIVSSVKKVTDLVAEITAASREQSTGVEQVNQAVVSMDQVVQANAAQTEELSATARTLADQAASILELMSGFKVDDGQTRARSRDRAPAPVAPPTQPSAIRRSGSRPSAGSVSMATQPTRPATAAAPVAAPVAASSSSSERSDEDGFIEF